MVIKPHLGAKMVAWLKRQEQTEVEAKDKHLDWHYTYMNLEKLTKEWTAVWLISESARACKAHGEDGILTVEMLNQAEMWDPSSTKQMYHWVTGTSPSTYLPREALKKDITGRMSTKRAIEMGDRARFLSRPYCSALCMVAKRCNE